ncbi:MAG TPA: hypothetical protein VLA19_00380 [Herpetosiphonaceae bacterium]|nr:hypothetical protein [Herpetosiphonaceae bacterium]
MTTSNVWIGGGQLAAGAQTTWYASSELEVLCILGGAWTGLPTG